MLFRSLTPSAVTVAETDRQMKFADGSTIVAMIYRGAGAGGACTPPHANSGSVAARITAWSRIVLAIVRASTTLGQEDV